MPNQNARVFPQGKTFLIFCVLFLGNYMPVASQTTPVSFLNRSNLIGQTSKSGVTMAIADMNQDGKDDIVTLNQGKFLNIHYQNEALEPFSNVGSPIISNDPQWAMAIADYDNNGLNDIVVGGDFDNIKVLVNENGNDQFGLLNINNSSQFLQTTNFIDLDNDGWLDIFACNDDGDNRKYLNNGRGSFIYAPYLIDTKTTPPSDIRATTQVLGLI